MNTEVAAQGIVTVGGFLPDILRDVDAVIPATFIEEPFAYFRLVRFFFPGSHLEEIHDPGY